jgi:hypothetical protein
MERGLKYGTTVVNFTLLMAGRSHEAVVNRNWNPPERILDSVWPWDQDNFSDKASERHCHLVDVALTMIWKLRYFSLTKSKTFSCPTLNVNLKHELIFAETTHISLTLTPWCTSLEELTAYHLGQENYPCAHHETRKLTVVVYRSLTWARLSPFTLHLWKLHFKPILCLLISSNTLPKIVLSTFHAFLISPIRITCPTHFTFHDLITPKISREVPVITSLSYILNILFSSLFSDIIINVIINFNNKSIPNLI